MKNNTVYDSCGGGTGGARPIDLEGGDTAATIDSNLIYNVHAATAGTGRGINFSSSGNKIENWSNVRITNNRLYDVDNCFVFDGQNFANTGIGNLIANNTCAEPVGRGIYAYSAGWNSPFAVTFQNNLFIDTQASAPMKFVNVPSSGYSGFGLPTYSAFYCTTCATDQDIISWKGSNYERDGDCTPDSDCVADFDVNSQYGDPSISTVGSSPTLKLTSASGSAYDKGASLTGFSTDFEGDPRPQGFAWDIGADEYVSAAMGNNYYVDLDAAPGVGCNDSNPGTDRAVPWCTIPGTRTADNSAWLREAWGNISNTNKLTAGDTVWIKAGTTHSSLEGGRIIIGMTGGISFWGNGTSNAPIQLRVHPSWGTDNVTIDCANMTIGDWESCINSSKGPGPFGDWLHVRGAGPDKRFVVKNSRGVGIGTYGMIGKAYEYVEVSGNGYFGMEIGGSQRVTVKNSLIHHNSQAGLILNGQSQGVTIVDTETYNNGITTAPGYLNKHGNVVWDSGTPDQQVVWLRVKSYGNIRDGFDTGLYSAGESLSTYVLFLESESHDNGEDGFACSGSGSGPLAYSPSGSTVCSVVNSISYRNSGFVCYGWDGASCYFTNSIAHNAGIGAAGIAIGGNNPITIQNSIDYKQSFGLSTRAGGTGGAPILNSINSIYIPPSLDNNAYVLTDNPSPPPAGKYYYYDDNVSSLFGTYSGNIVGIDNPNNDSPALFTSVDPNIYGNNNYVPSGATAKSVDAGMPYCRIVSASGSGTVFSVDCDPRLYFFDNENRPFVEADVAYVGVGTNAVCAIDGLNSNSITCTSPITWIQGEGVSRKPVYGTAPDIGAFEYTGSTPPPPPPAFDFSLTNSGNVSVSQGGSAVSTITATLVNGTPASLNFSAVGLPSDVTASFSPVSCSPNCSSTLTINASASITLGNSTITITATSPSLTKTTTLALTISDTSAPTFTTAPATTNTTANGATISFVTNEPTTATLDYGVTSQYGSTLLSQGGATQNHTLALTNLQSDTTYHYRVRVKDSANNETASLNQTLKTLPPADTVAPSPVTDLRLVSAAPTSLNLSWTSSGDDATQGQAARYDLRLSTSPITDINFSSATRLTGFPTPKPAGGSETYTVVGLNSSTTYYLALKATDDSNLTSTISNILQAQTTTPPPPAPSGSPSPGSGSSSGGGGYIPDTTPPAPVTGLRIQAADKEVRLSWANPADTDFVRTSIVRKDGPTPPSSPTDGTLIYEGTAVSFTDINLTNDQSYSYALFTLDRAGNRSGPLTSPQSVSPQGNITTVTSSEPAMLEGLVTADRLSGSPLVGVTVTLKTPTTTLTATTDSSGRYRFSNLLPGSYTLAISYPKRLSYTPPSLVLLAGQTLTQNYYFKSPAAPSSALIDLALSKRLAGRILLQVQSHGEAWYVNPQTLKRSYLGRPADAFKVMREQGLGITNANLLKIPEVKQKTIMPRSLRRLSGRILLQVQSHGEAWYVNPQTLKRSYLGRPHDAFRIMREQGLGISNKDLTAIQE